ncbi:MAG: class I SAM-dependent DNA methyltransferase, partial [Geminicoccaceae bacterium]
STTAAPNQQPILKRALRKGSDLQDRPRYTHTSTFATFPFPAEMTPEIPVTTARLLPAATAIENAARQLNRLRHAWLHPDDLVVKVSEVVPGFPDRLSPRDEACAKELRKRTLTNLYNQRPTWLDNLHRELDAAVAAAYGWPTNLSDDEILKRLFDLNQERAAVGR